MTILDDPTSVAANGTENAITLVRETVLVRHGVIQRPDHELVQVRIRPAHRRLKQLMQLRQRH